MGNYLVGGIPFRKKVKSVTCSAVHHKFVNNVEKYKGEKKKRVIPGPATLVRLVDVILSSGRAFGRWGVRLEKFGQQIAHHLTTMREANCSRL